MTATEGFAYSFKPQSYGQIVAAKTLTAYQAPGNPTFQDIPGFAYRSESGFTPQNAGLVGLTSTTAGEQIGIADRGTQLMFTVAGLSSGVTLYAPSYIYLSGPYGALTPVGVAVLINQSQSVGGAFSTSSAVPVAYSPAVTGGPTAAANGPDIPVASSGTGATLIYEIYYADSSVARVVERADQRFVHLERRQPFRRQPRPRPRLA